MTTDTYKDGWSECLGYLYAHCHMGQFHPHVDTLYALVRSRITPRRGMGA